MIINLTPHPIRIFEPDTPDVVDEYRDEDILDVIPRNASFAIAHLSELELGAFEIDGISIENVQYNLMSYTPPQVTDTYYVVPPATALSCRRGDFVVPHSFVRNSEGTVIGCRKLARPI